LPINALQIAVNSVLTGSVYALIAIGLTLVYRILKFANFSHAEMIATGAYLGLAINTHISDNILVSVAGGFLFAGLLGVASEFLVFRPLRRRGAERISLMVASIGLGLVIRHSIQQVWGSRTLWYTLDTKIYTIRIGDAHATLTSLHVVMILASILTVSLVHIFLTRTKLGKAMRATSDNPSLAMACGINVDRVVIWVWFLGAGLAGIGGVLRGADTRLIPLVGWEVLLPAFAVVILGGVGNLYGTIIAAYILGLAENVGVLALSGLSLSTGYRSAIAFVVLIVVLLVKPTGLMGSEKE
jgi:branched-subunit amino acid ABC-type transport system permease component